MSTRSASCDQFSVLLALVRRIVPRNSGEFDATLWLEDWLSNPLPALGDRKPEDVLQQPGGFEVVYAILARMQSGAFC